MKENKNIKQSELKLETGQLEISIKKVYKIKNSNIKKLLDFQKNKDLK